MSLAVKCTCGTDVQPPADAADRRVNCPTCGSVIFFVAASTEGSEELETYGFAVDSASDPGGEPDDVPDSAPDASAASGAPSWLDRYKADSAARKGEHEQALALIEKAATSNVASDPFVAALVLAVRHPPSPTTVAALSRVVIGKHPVYAPIAAAFLEHVGPTEARAARETLRLLGEVSEPADQMLISSYLRRIGPTSFVQVRDLIELLASKHTMLFVWAVQCLGMIGPAAGSAVEVLIKSLKIPDHDLRIAVIDALGLIAHDADRSVPVLLRAVKLPGTDYRLHAAQALGQFPVPAAKAALEALQNDTVTEVREAALKSLQTIAAKAPLIPSASAGNAPLPIDFACPCGKRLRAKPELAGRKVKCPACGAVSTLPAPAAPAGAGPAAPAPGPTGSKVCPDCLATVPAAVVLCVHCGLDFRTGKPMTAGQKE